ncbi:MAG: glycoside hydrolase family 97 C-terminal domain-containing protein, partial [Tannerellaceae bacterium]
YKDAADADADWISNPTAFEITQEKITKASKLTLPMAAGGGFAITIKPAIQ